MTLLVFKIYFSHIHLLVCEQIGPERLLQYGEVNRFTSTSTWWRSYLCQKKNGNIIHGAYSSIISHFSRPTTAIPLYILPTRNQHHSISISMLSISVLWPTTLLVPNTCAKAETPIINLPSHSLRQLSTEIATLKTEVFLSFF